MTADRTIIGPFGAGRTMQYTAVLVDAAGVLIPSTSLQTLTLTHYAVLWGDPIVNACDHVSILNAGRGTIDTSGNLAVTLAPADMVNLSGLDETHVLLIEWTYNAGAKAGSHEVGFTLQAVTRQ